MRIFSVARLLGSVAAGAVLLTGCSTNALVWGSDGARVIDTTEQLISEMGTDGGSSLLCTDAELELGTQGDWRGRSAGEPERFTGDFWAEQVPLDPQWSINIEGLPVGAAPGGPVPRGCVLPRDR